MSSDLIWGIVLCLFVAAVAATLNLRKVAGNLLTILLFILAFLLLIYVPSYDFLQSLLLKLPGGIEARVDYAEQRLSAVTDAGVQRLQQTVADHQAKIDGILQNTQNQKQIMEFLAEGMLAWNSRNFDQSSEYFKKIVELEPHNDFALDLMASSSLLAAYDTDDEGEKADLLNRANQAFMALISLSPDNKAKFAFEIAAVRALQRNEAGCKEWLQVAETSNKLPAKDHLFLRHSYFGPFDTKEWFKQLNWPSVEDERQVR